MKINQGKKMTKEKNKLGIFTKPIHLEKIVNYLNQNTDLNYVISTQLPEVEAYDFDVGISYCFPEIINIHYPVKDRRMWYNYHPGILPEYPGLQCYSLPISEKVMDFGVTLNIMTMEVDKGGVLMIKRFPLESHPVNSNELGTITHYHLFQLFKKTIEYFAEHRPKNRKEFKEWDISDGWK